ncbi:hypothetical protein [Geobacter sp. DSM 9736]|uniref:hypothetical protein n=1 Tax=Geobacter sp. DSM 9736 TaxID=1277350 RepID=UPI000B513C5D|nr:hypothetical protein [Geobacter sp. DSM 9736]SNB44671.1 hypothetical protein SAMN06269301_0058 [Geobacter sp. DSM 9736]
MTNEMKKAVAAFLTIGTLAVSCPALAQNSEFNSGDATADNAQTLVREGREIFRFDTYGDEQFWGGKLRLHEAIAGQGRGGVGNGLTPTTAINLGLKVDVDALPQNVVQGLQSNTINLNDPATTLALLQVNAVVGVKGNFSPEGRLSSVGFTCALCHSTVDNSLAFGIGHRLDGWSNRDLDVGKIVALAPDVSPFVQLLRSSPGNEEITPQQVRNVLSSWGPGKFDAQLLLDGKAFRPDGGPAATLIPDAFGMAGVNLHTWTGAWGTVTYWNAFVAALELQGVGNFFDPRLDDPAQFPDIAPRFPIAVANRLGHKKVDPASDLITSKLPALHFYQLAIPAPKPQPGVHFNEDAAERGDALFSGKARCNECHVEPLWTEPGWNAHRPQEIGIDSFQAERSPDRVYKTAKLSGLYIRENGLFMKPENKGKFFHDGRFRTLLDVVNHYNSFFGLALTEEEKRDLVEYLKSI